MAPPRRARDTYAMSMRESVAAITNAARSVELSRTAREQTEEAILVSQKLLKQPVYPDDRVSPPEQ